MLTLLWLSNLVLAEDAPAANDQINGLAPGQTPQTQSCSNAYQQLSSTLSSSCPGFTLQNPNLQILCQNQNCLTNVRNFLQSNGNSCQNADQQYNLNNNLGQLINQCQNGGFNNGMNGGFNNGINGGFNNGINGGFNNGINGVNGGFNNGVNGVNGGFNNGVNNGGFNNGFNTGFNNGNGINSNTKCDPNNSATWNNYNCYQGRPTPSPNSASKNIGITSIATAILFVMIQ